VLAGKHRRALDSTVLDDAVATQDTVTQLVAAVRRVIREVPGAGDAAGARCSAHDYRDPGKPKIAWDDEEARAALVSALVNDALSLLAALPDQPEGPAADGEAVDVDLEGAAGNRLEGGVLAHPADQRDRIGKVPEDLLGRGGQLHLGDEQAGGRLISHRRLSRLLACHRDRRGRC